MRARSNWVFRPKLKATWVAIAAGSLAGLAVFGACSDAPVSRVAGPSMKVSDPRFHLVGGAAHVVRVCVEESSTPGTYNFTVARRTSGPTGTTSRPFELPPPAPSDPVPNPAFYTQTNLGPYTPGDMLTTAPSVTLLSGALEPACVTVFQRDDTPTHANNRMQNTVNNGTVNPYATVNVTLGALPAGSAYTALCTNDDPLLPQTPGCVIPGEWSNTANYSTNQLVTFDESQWKSLQNGNQGHQPAENTFWTAYTFPPIVANPIYSSANVFSGSTITYTITAPASVCPLGSVSAAFNATAIPAPRTVWFVASLRPSGPIVDGTVITFTGANIHLSDGGLPPAGVDIPSTNGQITYSASAPGGISTTSYNVASNTWETIVPLGKGENIFLAGTQYTPPGGLTGGAHATWTGAFASTTPGVTASWQLGAAVYDPFNLDYNALGVKPLSSNSLTIYPNSDKQGTPENYKPSLKSGAMGAGSNYIGSYTTAATVCVD